MILLYRIGFLSALAILSATIASATPVVYSGAFQADDQVLLINLTSDGTSTTVIESYSYAGGSVNSITYSAGGFVPEITLFDGTGAQVLDSNSGYSGDTSHVGTDPVTGNSNDIYISQVFAAGDYTLALTVFNNLPYDGTLADGFKQDSNPGFTCAETGTAGPFCDVTDVFGRSRTGDYAFSIDTIPSSASPEPSPLIMTVFGFLMVGVSQLRRAEGSRKSNRQGVL